MDKGVVLKSVEGVELTRALTIEDGSDVSPGQQVDW